MLGQSSSLDRVLSTPAKKAAPKLDKIGVVPLAVRTLCKMHQSGNFTLGGREFGSVVLVGTLERAEVLQTNAEYTLNDGTGSLPLKDFLSDERVNRDEFRVGQCVRVCGDARGHVEEFYVSIKSISTVQNPIEVGHHRIACVKTLCALDQGVKVMKAELDTPIKTTPIKKEATTPTKEAPVAQALVGADLEAKIAELVNQLSVGSEEIGCTVAQVCQRLTTPEHEVRAVVKKLLDSGTFYTTIDDEHIAAC